MTEPDTTPRDRLIAHVALLKASRERSGVLDVNAAWQFGEDYVAALELFPQNTAKCPCCDKSVQLCTKHYLLHEPGKSCLLCRGDE